VGSFVGLFLSCVSACDLFSFDLFILTNGDGEFWGSYGRRRRVCLAVEAIRAEKF